MDRLLPEGWIRGSGQAQQTLQRELETELPLTNPHPLAGLALRVITEWEEGDSVLGSS